MAARPWRNDPEAFRWFRQKGFINDAQQEAWFERMSEDPSIEMCAVIIDDGERQHFGGVTGLTSIDYYKSAEVSILVAPEFREAGVGRKALYELCNHAFLNMGLHSIWAEVLETNVRGQILFQTLGFTPTGVNRERYYKLGRWENAHRYDLLESEWKVLAGKLSP